MHDARRQGFQVNRPSSKSQVVKPRRSKCGAAKLPAFSGRGEECHQADGSRVEVHSRQGRGAP